MPSIAVVDPNGLVGRELLTQLDAHPSLGLDVTLVSRNSEDAGILTRVGDAAGLVGNIADVDLERFDVVLLCNEDALDHPNVKALPETTGMIVLSSGEASRLPPAVAFMGLPASRHLSSPHPACVALTHLLLPLLPLGLRRASASVILPASMLAEGALDELLEQTRALLSFESLRDNEYFPTQMGFNLLPADDDADVVAAQTAACLSAGLPLSVSCTRAAVFHGLSINLHIEMEAALDSAVLRDALEAYPGIVGTDEPHLLGPVRSAGEDHVILGDLRAATGSSGIANSYRLWAVMDNLTVGCAANAVALAELLTADRQA